MQIQVKFYVKSLPQEINRMTSVMFPDLIELGRTLPRKMKTHGHQPSCQIQVKFMEKRVRWKINRMTSVMFPELW